MTIIKSKTKETKMISRTNNLQVKKKGVVCQFLDLKIQIILDEKNAKIGN